jgi:RNA polymerase-binding transcription factor DksA
MRIKFPSSVLAPVGDLLKNTLSKLERRKRVVTREDPFLDTDRVNDNAATDIEADEQFGHARVSAIKQEIDRMIVQTKKALSRVKIGKYGLCEDCGNLIDTDRLMVYPEATLCASCQKKKEK